MSEEKNKFDEMENEKPKVFEKRTYTVNEIQDILGIGISAAYSLVKAGHFKVVRVGGSIRISKRSFDRWLDSLDCEL